MMATFPERLKLLRKEKMLNQTQLGEIVGVKLDAVYQWEKGARRPSFSIIEDLADYFDVSVGYLLGSKEDRTKPSERLSDEEAAQIAEAEEEEAKNHFYEIYCDLSPEMKEIVSQTLGRAYRIDERRGALLSQQKPPEVDEEDSE